MLPYFFVVSQSEPGLTLKNIKSLSCAIPKTLKQWQRQNLSTWKVIACKTQFNMNKVFVFKGKNECYLSMNIYISDYFTLLHTLWKVKVLHERKHEVSNRLWKIVINGHKDLVGVNWNK